MKSYNLFICAAALALACACSKTQLNPEVSNVNPLANLNITASFESVEGSKADFVDPANKNYNIKWEVGDSIWVSNQPTTTADARAKDPLRASFVVKSVSAEGVAKFEPRTPAELEKLHPDSTVFYATLGGNASATTKVGYMWEENVVQSVISSESYLTPNSLKSPTFIAGARAVKDASGNINFRFVNVIGFLKITIPDCTTNVIKKIMVFGSGTTGTAASTYLSCLYKIHFNNDGTFNSYTRGGTILKNGAGQDQVAGGNANIGYYNTSAKLTFEPGVYYLPMVPGENVSLGIAFLTSTSTGSWANITAGKQTNVDYYKEGNLVVERGHVRDLGIVPLKNRK